MRGLSRHFRLEAVFGQTRELRELLREGNVDFVERGLELVEVEILKLEGARENDAIVVEAVARVDELTRVQLEQRTQKRLGSRPLLDVADVHPNDDERWVDPDRNRRHVAARLDEKCRRPRVYRLKV